MMSKATRIEIEGMVYDNRASVEGGPERWEIVSADSARALGEALRPYLGGSVRVTIEPVERRAGAGERGKGRVMTELGKRPAIVTLCGSTRFWRTFQQAGLRETLAGKIVLSIGAATGTDDEHFGNLPAEQYFAVKEMLDELHLHKVAMADEVLVLNVGGYVGQSTAREVAVAIERGKPLRWWEDNGDARTWPVDLESYRRIKRAVEQTCGNGTIGQMQ